MLKRIFDIAVASIVLIILSPVIVWLCIKVFRNLGSPILFKQQRPGLNGKVFEMIKFRSMIDAKEQEGKILPDEKRITKFGHWLRATSLDELPELWNVLKGDMSLIGPRPLLVEYLPLYNEVQMTRHNVRPGITGWAQINGRNTLSWEDKFDLDVWYVNNQSFILDMKILFVTLKKVLLREGISAEGQVTMDKFRGNS